MSAPRPALHATAQTVSWSGEVSVHGVAVRWRTAGLAQDLAAPLLARFPRVGAGAPADQLELVVAPSAGAVVLPEGYRQTCFFGPVRGYTAGGGDLLLTDGASRAHVDARGTRIDAAFAAAATDAQTFTAVMLVVALVVALRHRGMFHLHAATLVHPEPPPGGTPWLVAGGSGAGKTTTTLALLSAGLAYLADDATLVTTTGGTVTLLGIPREFHLTAATLAAFPALAPYAQPPVREGWPKHPLDPRAAFPGRERARAGAPGVLLFPEVVAGSSRTELVPLAPADAMGELLLASAWVVIEGLPHPREHLGALESIVRGARAFRLALGRDTLEAPSLLRARIESALGG